MKCKPECQCRRHQYFYKAAEPEQPRMSAMQHQDWVTVARAFGFSNPDECISFAWHIQEESRRQALADFRRSELASA